MKKVISIALLIVIMSFGLRAETLDVYFKNTEDKILRIIKETPLNKQLNTFYYGSYLMQYSSFLRNVLSAYSASEISSLDEASKALISNLNNALGEFQKNTGMLRPSFQEKIERQKKDIPNPSSVPDLQGTEPFLFLTPLTGDLFFEIKGVGNLQSETGKTPALEVGDLTVAPFYQAEGLLEFTMPTSSFTISENGLSVAKVRVSIPYMWKKSKKATEESIAGYTLLIGFYPSSPGILHFSSVSTSNTDETKKLSTKTYIQHSSNRDIIEDYCIPNQTGWELVSGSINLVIESSSGIKNTDWSYYKSGTKNCYTVETIYNRTGTSGKLSFHLDYEIKRGGISKSKQQKSTPLKWGDAIVYDTGGGEWTLILKEMNGVETAITTTTLPPFLTLSKEKNRLKIHVANIEDLIHLN